MSTIHVESSQTPSKGDAPTSRLSMIAQITSRLARTLDFGQAIQDLIDDATRLLGAEQGTVMLLEHDNRTLRLVAAHGVPEEELATTQIEVGFGIAGAVAETGRPLIQKHRAASGSLQGAAKLDAGLCVPIAIHGKLLGVIGFENRERPTRFEREDVEFAQLVADQAAIALYCDLLHEEFQDVTADEAALDSEANSGVVRHMAAA